MNIRTLIPIFGFFALTTGCSDPAADAERELAIIENAGGSADEICEARRKVAEAYLAEQNAGKYRRAKSKAALACNRALLDRL